MIKLVHRPRSGQTTYHRDGTVTTWDVYRERWVRARKSLPDEVIATMGADERVRVLRHIDRSDHALAGGES
ncbi:MAG TPA: hypothetical protein VMY39_02780 [Planctomycetota bacterium]|nr:hypothetical protein [Planctomycetota bacterium]